VLDLLLPPFGSTVTNTASICARANLNIQRFFASLSS
jgi:hypothetical protein